MRSTPMSLPVKFRQMLVVFIFTLGTVAIAVASLAFAYQASLIPASRLINPDELVKIIQSAKGEKPLMIQVGSHVLYTQAHIPGSEYVGPASSETGLQSLRKRVESLPKSKFIVLYCGCCPWDHCPNIRPAYKELKQMGFTRLKVLYLASIFGSDWVEKGYPAQKGE